MSTFVDVDIIHLGPAITTIYIAHINMKRAPHSRCYPYSITVNTSKLVIKQIPEHHHTTSSQTTAMSVNPDSATPAQGEFRSKVAPSKPLTTKGVRSPPHTPIILLFTHVSMLLESSWVTTPSPNSALSSTPLAPPLLSTHLSLNPQVNTPRRPQAWKVASLLPTLFKAPLLQMSTLAWVTPAPG